MECLRYTCHDGDLGSKLYLTHCDPVDCSPPGSSVHGTFQERILEWVAISFSKGVFLTQGLSPCLLHWQTDSLPPSHRGSPCTPHPSINIRMRQKLKKDCVARWVSLTFMFLLLGHYCFFIVFRCPRLDASAL